MKPTLRGTAEAVFGSRTRARVLGYLAASEAPQTGYALSKELGIGVAKAYRELKALEAGGVIRGRLDVRGRKRFSLEDGDLRRFLLRQMRFLRSEEWLSAEKIAQRRRRFEEAKKIPLKAPTAPGRPASRLFAEEFRRPLEKDRALRRVARSRGR